MKPQKAIEILSYRVATGRPPEEQDYRDALKLGIEALKRLEHDRLFHNYHNLAPLPGETIEEEPKRR